MCETVIHTLREDLFNDCFLHLEYSTFIALCGVIHPRQVRANDEVAQFRPGPRFERQHVGRTILPSVEPVQTLDLPWRDETHPDDLLPRQSVHDPTGTRETTEDGDRQDGGRSTGDGVRDH